jgi:adenine-specific DNA-methyltransferase
MKDIFGNKAFPNPKDHEILTRLIRYVTCGDKNAVIMDSFAGSGTTGHAVLALNTQDSGNRRFILVEMEPNIAHDITAVRLQNVIQGYTDTKNEKVQGLGGGFRFCELSSTLFDANGQIRNEVSFSDLAAHVFFTETSQPLPKVAGERTPLLGIANGTAIYLLYNGVMRDQGNVLTLQTFESLPSFDGPKVIFGDGCKIGRERLRELNITFRQIPYEVKVR